MKTASTAFRVSHRTRSPRSSSPSKWRTSISLLLVVVLLHGGPSFAGFKYPRDAANPSFDGYPLGDGSNSQANMEKIQKTKDKLGERINAERMKAGLMPLMGAELATAAAMKFDAVRANICAAADLIACQIEEDFGKAKKDCLKDLLKKGAVCVDMSDPPGSQGAQFCDTSADCKDDKINIHVTKVGCTVVPCYDPAFWSLVMTLYEETYHSLQDFTAPGNADANKARAERQKKAACNERDVDDESIPINQALCAGLENLANGMAHGQTSPMVKKVLDKIAALPAGAAKDAAIAALKAQATAEVAFDSRTRVCYDSAKEALMAFLAMQIDLAELNRRLGTNEWQIAGQTAPLTQPVNYSSDASSGTIEQRLGETITPLATGLAGVYDTLLVRTGAVLLVSGVLSNGMGSVIAFADLDGDGFFSPSTLRIIVPGTPQLQLKLDLFTAGEGAPVFLFEGQSLQILSLPDIDLDGVPDTLGPPISQPFSQLIWVRHFRMTSNGRLLGFETPSTDGNYPPNLTVFELRDQNGDQFYETLAPHTTFGDVGFDPAPRTDPLPGATSLELLAMPGSQLLIWTLNTLGQRQQPIGSAIVPENGMVVMAPLLRPVQAGEVLLVDDMTHNGLSNPIHVTVPSPVIGDLQLGGNTISFAFDTIPGVIYRVESTANIENLTWPTLQVVPGNGSRVSVTYSAPPPRRFYRIAVDEAVQ